MSSAKGIGWINLECVLQCASLGISAISPIVQGLLKQGIHLGKSNGLLAYEEWAEPLNIGKGVALAEFIMAIRGRPLRYVVSNFIALFADVKAPLSVSFHFAQKIMVLSTPENMMWKMTDDIRKADFSRLEAFSRLAAYAAEAVQPTQAYIGPETFGGAKPVSEMGLERFGTEFFSNARLGTLFDGYLHNYGHMR